MIELRQRGSSDISGYSLIELLAVVAVIGALLTVGFGVMGGSGRARRTAVDATTGMIDRARNTAISARREVLLAVAGPDDVPDGDGRCRLGMFELDEVPGDGGVARGRQVGRWRPLPMGMIAAGGSVEGLRNVLDVGELTLRYKVGSEEVEARVSGMAFNPRGGLSWPAGSDPMVLRLAEGGYVRGVPTETRREDVKGELIRVGRVVARPWRAGS